MDRIFKQEVPKLFFRSWCVLLFALAFALPVRAEVIESGEPHTIRLSATIVESADYVLCRRQVVAQACDMFFRHRPVFEEDAPFKPLERSEAWAMLRSHREEIEQN